MLSQHLSTQPLIISAFAKLLTSSGFCMATQSSGITWLELFFLSVAASSNPWALLHSSSASTQPTIARQLREFAAAATVTLRFMLTDGDQKHFLASQKQPNRLAAFGYQNRTLHTSTFIQLRKSTQSALHEVMLSFRQPLSQDQRSALADGTLNIKTAKFAGHHVFKGGRTIIKLSEQLRHDLVSVQTEFAQAPDQPCSFFCPNGHFRSSDAQLDCFNVTKSIWFTQCRGCHASTAWKCPCNIAWHKCFKHFSCPSLVSAVAPKKAARGSKRPAAVPNETSATSLRRLEPNTPSRACLGPRLAARAIGSWARQV